MRRLSVLFALLFVSAATFASTAVPTETYHLTMVRKGVIVTQKDLLVPAQGTAEFADVRKVPYHQSHSDTQKPNGDQVIEDTFSHTSEGLTAMVTRLASHEKAELIRLTLDYAQIESITHFQVPNASSQNDLVSRYVYNVTQTVWLKPGQSVSSQSKTADGNESFVLTLTRVATSNQVATL